MVILELSFPAGRYHATPWGRHVNEGAVEWPPSPWRIVRALVATWHLKAREEIPQPTTIRSLLDKLSQPPGFHLPKAVAFHTRHYMPLIEGKNEKPTKIFDTFIQLPKDKSILVQWNVDLSAEEMAALRTLAARLGYFGRTESLVLAHLRNDMPKDVNASPLSDGDRLPEKHEGVRLLCPLAPGDYEQWRTDFLAKISEPKEGKKQKTRKSAKGASELAIPSDLFEAVHADTGSLQNAGWNLPPGAKFVTYSRSENALTPAPRQRLPRSAKPPTVARFTVVSAVPPRITKAVSVANRIHGALCSSKVTGQEICPLVFRGTSDERNPLNGHQHAHIFCEANGPLDVISHVTIWAPMGFDEGACHALRSINKVWGHGGHDLHLILHGIGQPADFTESSLFREASAWHSLTPFVSTRHEKCFRDGRPKIDSANGWQIGSPAHDLLRLISLNAKADKVVVRQHKNIPVNGRTLRCLQFQTIRHDGGGSRGTAGGASFSIEFPHKVSGPLALGYGSHFGLGLFVPDE